MSMKQLPPDPYKEGYDTGKLSLKTTSTGRVNPYLNPRPYKGDYANFLAWNKGYDDAVAKGTAVPEKKAKKKATVKKK